MGIIDFDLLREKAAEDIGLTPEQRKWKRLKALRKPTPVCVEVTQRKKQPCTCKHTRKHHEKTGHCRPGCDCRAGMR